MKILSSNKKYYLEESDILFVPVFVGESEILNEIDELSSGALRDELVASKFNAEFGEHLLCMATGKIKSKKIVLLGLGEKKDTNLETVRRWAGKCLQIAKKHNAKTISIKLPKLSVQSNIAQALAEGLWLADYRFLRFKKDEQKKHEDNRIESATICADAKNDKLDYEIREAAVGVLGTTFARDLTNEPSNHMRPRDLVENAIKIADLSNNIEIGVLGKKELEENEFGALLAVAKGSTEEPYLIHLFYSGSQKAKKRIALVGKGITFDSGGISLKPSDKMSDMKIDMAGAATVLGVFRALATLDLPLEIHGVIPTCENMPSGRATKPGDIVISHNGKSIEILNTDAEGRLVLADALSYVAKEFMPEIIVDFATLTGACMVALGEKIAGLMTESDALAQSITSSTKISGEDLWRLPLVKDYRDKMKSEIADIKNITDDKYAGAIMGGMFLQEFVPNEIEFAHIDIAGPAHETKGDIEYLPKGGTGFGVRTIVNWLKTFN